MAIVRDEQGYWIERRGVRVAGPWTRKAAARHWEIQHPEPEPVRARKAADEESR